MSEKYCQVCGSKLIDKELEGEGMVPFCPACNEFRFPMYNVAVSMIVINKKTDKILLIKQYGRDVYILVAGYVNRGEQLEHAVVRELKEETGMTASHIRFNRTKFFEPSNTLMCNFTVYVDSDSELSTNKEIDSFNWFAFDDARKNIKPGSLAAEFLNAYLDEL
ncbi:NAD+ diphosphatase [Oribacterium sp. KHPX15]|uniref:NAD(+) diphosphatase n=1 Tax=Oribacterium sp. KHPX15 TaxID=1855342 RepID=UPI00089AD455|nr:NUDIX domain-containing protein [Oribacterium sp. KHPX15]SEA72173.1 NAD+ diphosphatase [Oribacterium sp. KHPX15]